MAWRGEGRKSGGVAAALWDGVPCWSLHSSADGGLEMSRRGDGAPCMKLVNTTTHGSPVVSPVASPREQLSQHEANCSQVSSLGGEGIGEGPLHC